jgi:enoyl-[acyl-carrier-protein] reductase (NADH)
MPEPFPPLTEAYATPEEIGAVALFLVLDASRHVTGAAIYCDAGISLYG